MKILIVGAGIAGCSIARMLCENNEIFIIEKNDFIGGNCFDFADNSNTYYIHKYGPHIFHTSNEDVWLFVNKYAKFNNFINQVLVMVDDKLIEMPINLNSIKQIFPNEYNDFYQEIISLNIFNKNINILDLMNKLSSEKNKNIIKYFYDNVFANYTSKMWGIKIQNINRDVINRVKINLNYEWNYFPNDKYCGMPSIGYTNMLKNMINHKNINIELNSISQNFSFTDDKILFNNIEYDLVIYTGSLDELFNYEFGVLNYRSLYIEFNNLENINQSKPVVNYPQHPNMTRICDYKLLTSNIKDGSTTISKEYPGTYDKTSLKFNKRYYPINNDENNKIYNQYFEKAKKYKNLILLGRLAEYKYYDMDDIIEKCFNVSKQIKNNN